MQLTRKHSIHFCHFSSVLILRIFFFLMSVFSVCNFLFLAQASGIIVFFFLNSILIHIEPSTYETQS